MKKARIQMIRGLVGTILSVFMAVSVAMAVDTQTISIIPSTISGFPGESATLEVIYDNATGKTTGIGLRVHFDSRLFSSASLEDVLGDGLVAYDAKPVRDVNDLDKDSSTDQYIGAAWMSLKTDWPAFSSLPVNLANLKLAIRGRNTSISTKINITTSGTAAGYLFSGHGATLEIKGQ